MVLGLRQDHALRGDDLGGAGVAFLLRDLHRLDERLADVADDLTAGRFLFGVQSERLEDFAQNFFVMLRLLEVVLPFLLQIGVLRAGERARIDLNASNFGFESFVQEIFRDGFHGFLPPAPRQEACHGISTEHVFSMNPSTPDFAPRTLRPAACFRTAQRLSGQP